MADEKKPGGPKSVPPLAPSWKPIDVVIVLVVLVSVLGALATGLSNFLSSNNISFFGIPLSSFKDFFLGKSLLFKFFSFFVSALCIVGIITLSLLRGEIWKAERAKLFPGGEDHIDSKEGVPPPDDESRKTWERIVEQAESTSESNWRIAIIEADIMLDDLLYKLGLPGDTIGDKLKAVEKSDFLTLDDAWEAHKVRNQIAHGGSGFQLNQREARQAISHYEKVFREFYLI